MSEGPFPVHPGPAMLAPAAPAAQPPVDDTPDVPRRVVSTHSFADMLFHRTVLAAGTVTVLIMLAVGVFLSLRASTALGRTGLAFFTTQDWSPETQTFGVAAVLFGTVSIALIALSVSFPLSLGTALLLSEVLQGRLRNLLVSLVDLMAAVPSIVFGLWGVYFLQGSIIPVSKWISIWFGWIPIFAVTDVNGQFLSQPSAFTSSAFIAGIVVGLMVVPTQTSIMREAFTRAPVGGP